VFCNEDAVCFLLGKKYVLKYHFCNFGLQMFKSVSWFDK